jgi:hypothetical protein
MSLSQNNQCAGHEPVKVASALLSIREAVMEHWEQEVRARVNGVGDMLGPALTQALPMLFDDIAMALASNSPMPNRPPATENDSPAAHGIDRARHTSFGPEQVAYKYQLF